MEYTKDIILDIRVKRLNAIKLKIQKGANILKNIIINNKLIVITITALLFFIIIDLILINSFMKLFSTLY